MAAAVIGARRPAETDLLDCDAGRRWQVSIREPPPKRSGLPLEIRGPCLDFY
jgi:hypothetical protein